MSPAPPATRGVPAAAAFDLVAPVYDSVFTRTALGRWLRERVWSVLERAFAPGTRVLELNCGTGEDALWLARRGVRVLATDVSPSMLEAARAKAAREGVGDRISFAPLDLDTPRLPPGTGGATFDGALSNFGGLNCVRDRRAVAAFLAREVRQGGRVVLVVMGPWCPWELAWFALHGDWRTATRRLRRGGVEAEVEGRPVHVWYPSRGQLRREFAPWFRARRAMAIGAFVPPPALQGVVERRPRAFAALAAAECRLAGIWPFTVLNDHFLLELERSPAPPPAERR